MFDRLFGWGKKKDEAAPAISFGRYSDNNKTVEKTARWTDADNLAKEKKYIESINTFFEYLRDDAVQNVSVMQNGDAWHFELHQGSKVVRGRFDNDKLEAEVTLAKMTQPSVPVMRKLLEMNFLLYYSRYALDGDRLCMCFDSETATANPNKLYYGLKELATKADKQDDLLVGDFSALQMADTDHIETIPDTEKEIKFLYLQQWIKENLDTIAALDPDKFSGGIAYMLLSLVYRIDYLIVPEGKLLNELEAISGIYFAKDEKPVMEKNRDMVEAFKKLQQKTREEVFPYLYRYKSTFAIVAPQQYKTIADNVYNAGQNVPWYRDNGYPEIARQITEYGFSYSQYSYSLPRPLSDLFNLFMNVNYSEYFEALGFSKKYYDKAANKFDAEAITARIKEIQDTWRSKYPKLDFKTANLKFDTIVNFNFSFNTEVEFLNFDNK
jgi:hypothetical protein